MEDGSIVDQIPVDFCRTEQTDGKTAEEIVKKKVYDAVYPYLLPTGWLSRKVGMRCDHKYGCDCL